MKKILLTLITAITCLALNAETWTIGGTEYTYTQESHYNLGSATTFTSARLTVAGDNTKDMTIHYSITDLTNSNVEARVVPASKTSFSVKTVGNTAATITDATPIVGINAGFFNMSSPYLPNGPQIVDGQIRRGFSGDGFSTITFNQWNVPCIGYFGPINCWAYNIGTQTETWTQWAAVNSTPAYVTSCGVGEQLIFYTPEYGSSGTSGAGGYAVTLSPKDGAKLTPGAYTNWTVTTAPTTENVTAPTGCIVMYGNGTQNGAFVKNLSVGSEVRLYPTTNIQDNDGNITQSSTENVIQQAAGGSLMILDNGNVITSYKNDLGSISTKQPRSAIGYNADKTKLMMLVVDGRNPGWTNGCTGIVLGEIMKKIGCSDALNLDGGGSSQIWNSTNGLANDAATNGGGAGSTYIRPVAETIFIVELPTPVLSASLSTLSFNTSDNATASNQVTVSGTDLRGDITLALSGTNADQFQLSATSIAKASASGTVTVTYKPTAFGTHTATLTISSTAATAKTITLSGTNTETVVTPPTEEPETPADPEVTEPTLKAVWENTSANLPANGRYATAFGGNIYISDYSNTKIVKVSGEGDSNVADYMTNSAFLGSAITSDQAGNIIISTATTGNATTLNNWAIIPAGSTSEIKTIEVLTPSAVTAGRVDQVGRVIGDVASADGAYMYMTPDASKIAVCAQIANNQVSTVNSSSEFKYAFSSSNIAQPMLTTASSISSTENYANYMYTKTRNSESIFYQATKYYTVTADSNLNGFDVFELGGVKYVVYPTSNLSFNVAILQNNEVVATETDGNASTAMYNSFVAEVVSATKANIYQYNCGKKAAMYTFEVPAGDATAIEEVEAEVEAPAEYYNLQGVKVSNPEKGLYIKRQGNNVTKVIL